MTVRISTPWVAERVMPRPLTEGEKHAQFTAHVREVADLKMPWLFPLLEEASAEVFTQPGIFFFVLPSNRTNWNHVPEIANLITTVPWVEEESVQQ